MIFLFIYIHNSYPPYVYSNSIFVNLKYSDFLKKKNIYIYAGYFLQTSIMDATVKSSHIKVNDLSKSIIGYR